MFEQHKIISLIRHTSTSEKAMSGFKELIKSVDCAEGDQIHQGNVMNLTLALSRFFSTPTGSRKNESNNIVETLARNSFDVKKMPGGMIEQSVAAGTENEQSEKDAEERFTGQSQNWEHLLKVSVFNFLGYCR